MRLGTRSLVAAAAVGLALGNLGRIPAIDIAGRAGAITFLDFTLLPLWTLLVVTLSRGTRHWRLDALSLWGLAFAAIATVSTVLAGPKWGLSLGEHAGVAAFLVRWLAYAGWYLVIVTDPDPDTAGRDAWTMMEKAILAMLFFGIFQSAFLPNFAKLIEPFTGLSFDYQGRRLVSSMLDPNFSGGLIVILLLMRLAREAEGIRTNRLTLALLAAGLVLTLSRASVLALAVSMVVLVMARGLRGQLLRLGAVAVAVMLPLLPVVIGFAQQFRKLQIDGSGVMRFIPWLRSVVMIRENPVLGVGFNAAGPAQEAHGWELVGGAAVSMDGGLLFVAVMTGLLGLTAFCGMLWAFGRAAQRTWNDPTVPAERRAFAIGGWTSMIAIIVQSLFGNGLVIPWLTLPLWILQARVMATAPRALPVRRGVLKPATAALLVVTLLGVAGCDPCSGVANCSTSGSRVLTGTIIAAEGQEPRAGVSVAVGTAYTETNAAGFWELALPGATDTTVTVTVAAPGGVEYSVPAVPVRATRVAGDGTHVGTWYDRPVLSYVLGVQRAGSFLNNVAVTFIADAAFGGQTYTGTTKDGFVRLAGLATTASEISGTLELRSTALGTRIYPGVRLEGEHLVQPDFIRRIFQVDRIHQFGGNVVHRGDVTPTPGATVTFTRTGGVGITPNPVTTTAVGNGFFVLGMEFHGFGETRGTLRVTPPGGGASYTYPDFRFSTYDSTAIRYIGLVGHGERWLFLAQVAWADDSAAVDWHQFRFTRTSGTVITPNEFVETSDGLGRLFLKASVSDTGFVTGTLTALPVGSPPIVVGTYTLRTYAGDTPPLLPVRYIPRP